MKPKGLLETTILMGIFAPLPLVWAPARLVEVFITSLIIGLSYVVLWHYWKGKNWARIVVLIGSVMALLNLVALPSASTLQMGALVLRALLGGFLLVWLNRSPVREFFRHGAESTAPQQVEAPNERQLHHFEIRAPQHTAHRCFLSLGGSKGAPIHAWEQNRRRACVPSGTNLWRQLWQTRKVC